MRCSGFLLVLSPPYAPEAKAKHLLTHDSKIRMKNSANPLAVNITNGKSSNRGQWYHQITGPLLEPSERTDCAHGPARHIQSKKY